MAGPTVTLAFAGDATQLTRSFKDVENGAGTMSAKLDSSGGKLASFGSKLDDAGEKSDGAHTHFMGLADTMDGLSTVMGFNISNQISMARGFADLADGVATTVLPAIGGMIAKIGVWTGLTEAQTTAQTELDVAVEANPLGLVVLAIAAAIAAGVLLWKNWDTIKGAFTATFGWIGDRFNDFVGLFDGLPGKIGSAIKGIAGIITAPFRLEFDAVAGLWNNTLGAVSFHVPDWVPGLGGKGFSFPQMPHLAEGGIVNGPTVALIGEAGPEAVVPLSRGAGMGGNTYQVTVQAFDTRDGGAAVVEAIKAYERSNGARWRAA